MKIVRKVSSPSVFLTFDDGPTPETRQVLDVLRSENVRATFFVVADRARANRAVLEEIIRDGHAVGHHSFDHSYAVFFASEEKLASWIDEGETVLSELGATSVGFRPPNGIVTPPLKSALSKKLEPLILWNVRFYDAVIPWTRGRAIKSLQRTSPGSIVLLHDAQRPSRIESYCSVLRDYIQEAKRTGVTFDRLTSELVRQQSFS